MVVVQYGGDDVLAYAMTFRNTDHELRGSGFNIESIYATFHFQFGLGAWWQ